MAEKRPQNYENHTRLDPVFHLFLVPLSTAVFVASAWNAVRHPGAMAIWNAVGALLFVFAVFLIRIYALKVQNRVIRLEERLRFSTLLPEPLRHRIGEFSERQLIALRFASDGELPGLATKVLEKGLTPAEIKKSITSWRPDYYRV